MILIFFTLLSFLRVCSPKALCKDAVLHLMCHSFTRCTSSLSWGPQNPWGSSAVPPQGNFFCWQTAPLSNPSVPGIYYYLDYRWLPSWTLLSQETLWLWLSDKKKWSCYYNNLFLTRTMLIWLNQITVEENSTQYVIKAVEIIQIFFPGRLIQVFLLSRKTVLLVLLPVLQALALVSNLSLEEITMSRSWVV